MLVGQTAMNTICTEFLAAEKAGKGNMATHGKHINIYKWLIPAQQKSEVIAALDRCQEKARAEEKGMASLGGSSSSSSTKAAEKAKKAQDKSMKEAAAFFE